MMKKSILLVGVFSGLMAMAAMAGTLGSVTVDHTLQVTNTQDLAAAAGTTFTNASSGACTEPRYFYQVGTWNCRLGVCRAVMTVYRQSCS
jgi:hypothetical protein